MAEEGNTRGGGWARELRHGSPHGAEAPQPTPPWGARVWAACGDGDWERALQLLSSGEGEPSDLSILMSGEGSQGEALSSLHLAASKGRYDVVAALLRRGCDVSIRTLPSGRTSLHLAMDMLNIVAEAVAQPAEPDRAQAMDSLPFITTVKLLLVNGGSSLPGAKDIDNKTCWEYCDPETVRNE